MENSQNPGKQGKQLQGRFISLAVRKEDLIIDLSERARRESAGEQGSVHVPAIGTPAIGTPAKVTSYMVNPKSDNESCNPPFGPPKD